MSQLLYLVGSTLGFGLVAWSLAKLAVRPPGPRVAVRGALAPHLDQRVALDGTFEGDSETTWPEGARPVAPHPDAPASADLRVPCIVRQGARIELRGALQVVSGRKHGRSRSVRTGDAVRVEGRLLRVGTEVADSDTEYREAGGGFALEGAADEAWPKRPIAVYGRPDKRAVWFTLPAGLSVAFFCVVCSLPQGPPVPAADVPRPGRPACVADAERALEAGDPRRFAATIAACSDVRLRAEAAWMVGHVDDAARDFAVARAAHPELPWSAAEVEAELLRDPARLDAARSAILVPQLDRLREQWFPGPDVEAKGVMHCISTRLVPVLAGGVDPERPDGGGSAPPMGERCELGAWKRPYDASCNFFQYGATYALHDPTHYHPLFPLYAHDAFPERRNFDFGSCRREADAYPEEILETNLVAQRALFAALGGDADAYAALAVTFDRWPALFEQSGPARAASAAYGDENENQHSLRISMAVIAAAAHHLGDEARFTRFTSYADAHSRAVFTELAQLEAGTLNVPPASRVPSEYTTVDLELFRVRNEHPELLFDSFPPGYRLPSRLSALVSSKPALRRALEVALAHGFWALPRNASSLETLFALFARRKAAELAGQTDLAEALRLAGQRHHRALSRSENAVAAFALESIVIKP